MSSSRKRPFSSVDAPNNKNPPAKIRKISLIELIKDKIQQIINTGFFDDSIKDKYIDIEELSQYLNQVNEQQKRYIINSLYKKDILDMGTCFVPLTKCIVPDLECNGSNSSKLIQIINLLLEHGMNLMSTKEQNGQLISYATLWDFEHINIDFSSQIDFINKYTSHPWHFNYFKKNGYLTLFSITFASHWLPSNDNHYITDLYSCHQLFGNQPTWNYSFTVQNVTKCIKSLHAFDFECFMEGNPMGMNVNIWNYDVQQTIKISDINKKLKYLTGYINSINDKYFRSNKQSAYIFIIIEMIKIYQKTILNAIKMKLKKNIPNIIINVIHQYTVRNISLFKDKSINYNNFFILCFKSLKCIKNGTSSFETSESYIDKRVQDWFNELFEIICLNDNEYDITLCKYIMNLQFYDFIDLCLYPYITQIMVKTLSLVLTKKNIMKDYDNKNEKYDLNTSKIDQSSLKPHFVRILLNINCKYESHGKWWGNLIVNVLKNINLDNKIFIGKICDKIAKHSRFDKWQISLKNDMVNAIKNDSVINGHKVVQQISNDLFSFDKESNDGLS